MKVRLFLSVLVFAAMATGSAYAEAKKSANGTFGVNYFVLDPSDRLHSSTTPIFSNGNLSVASSGVGSGDEFAYGAIHVTSGEWYFEATYTGTGSPEGAYVGIATNSPMWGYRADGTFYGGIHGQAETYTTGDVVGVYLNADKGRIDFYKNNRHQGGAGFNLGYDHRAVVQVKSPSAAFDVEFGAGGFTHTPPGEARAFQEVSLLGWLVRIIAILIASVILIFGLWFVIRRYKRGPRNPIVHPGD